MNMKLPVYVNRDQIHHTFLRIKVVLKFWCVRNSKRYFPPHCDLHPSETDYWRRRKIVSIGCWLDGDCKPAVDWNNIFCNDWIEVQNKSLLVSPDDWDMALIIMVSEHFFKFFLKGYSPQKWKWKRTWWQQKQPQ